MQRDLNALTQKEVFAWQHINADKSSGKFPGNVHCLPIHIHCRVSPVLVAYTQHPLPRPLLFRLTNLLLNSISCYPQPSPSLSVPMCTPQIWGNEQTFLCVYCSVINTPPFHAICLFQQLVRSGGKKPSHNKCPCSGNGELSVLI